MTIALGILAHDGVVIAADTQESIGAGFAKTEGYKIFSRVVEDENRSISISGAGDAGYLDALMLDLAQAFIDTPDPAEAEQKLRDACLAFYGAHIQPMKVRRDYQPHVVAGLHWKGGPSFLMTNAGSVLYRHKRPVAVGVGERQASALLAGALPEHRKDTAVAIAALVAAYTIFKVKNTTDGCGMGTHVTVLTAGHGKHFARSMVKALEQRFEDYESLENSLFAYAIGRPLRTASTAHEVLGQWARDTRESIGTAAAALAAASRGRVNFNDQQPGETDANGFIKLFGDAVVNRQAASRAGGEGAGSSSGADE